MKHSLSGIYGVLAEFDQPEVLVRAAQAVQQAGYLKMDAYSPFPVEGLSEAVGFPRDRVALITLLGGCIGGLTGYFMQWFANVIDYPIIVAGRPYDSWPSFIPITFELTVLGASLSAAIGMLALNRLPKPYHPVFNSPEFLRASVDRFFLCVQPSVQATEDAVQSEDFPVQKFVLDTKQLIASFQPLSVTEIYYEN